MENKTVLIIEDNQDLREGTAELLELANFNVLTAENGKIGVDMATQHKPDLIICDIMMPELDGFGVLYMLAKNEETASIPFIFLTAKIERTDIRKGMELGADDYLTKPFDDMELLNAIESRLRKKDLLKKQFSKGLEGYNQLVGELRKIENIKDLFTHLKTRNYKKKQTIYMEGDYAMGLYVVNKGKVKTYIVNEDGKEFITAILSEGDYFGYLALLQDTAHKECAEALEETEISIISKDEFRSLIYRNADISKKFIQMLSNEVKDKEEQLINIAYNSVRKRVSDALVNLYKKQKEGENTVNISREDLSNIVGTATETISRTLSDFKSEGLIEIKGGNITLINLKKLENMVN